MALKQEIVPFTDKNGYVNPAPVTLGSGRSCDNSTMFTSEEYVMLYKLGQSTPDDLFTWKTLITNSMTLSGLPARYPGFTDQDSPDNMVAILCACKVLNFPSVARSILWYGLKHLGCFNNGDPSKFDFNAMTWRQVQLFASTVAASFPSMINPLHWLARFLAFPAFVYAALVIFVSCWNAPVSDADSRRLSWHLIQSVAPVSLLCKIASLFWLKRLNRDYGVEQMKGVAAQYYAKGHPFIEYWVTK